MKIRLGPNKLLYYCRSSKMGKSVTQMVAYEGQDFAELERGWFFYSHAWDLWFHLLKRLEGKSVLDVGCGTGLPLALMKACFPVLDVRGCEPNDDARPIWDSRKLQVDIASATALPYEDDQFDTVVCSHVLEHINEEHTAIREMARVAAKRLLVVVPQGNVDEKNQGTPHLRYYDRVNLGEAFSSLAVREKKIYALPHHHMDNLVAEIEF